jgi:hypothetical protein
MITAPEDIALNTLQVVAKERYPDLSLDLVTRLYGLQKRFQFDSDRTSSIQALQRVLEEYVDAQGATK